MINIDNVKSNFKFLRSDITDFKITNNISKRNFTDELVCNFDIDYNRDILSPDNDKDSLYGVVTVMCKLQITQNDEVLIDADMVIHGLFSASSEISKDLFGKMLELNGITALYGILRGKLTAVSSLICPEEIINLPMINVSKLIEMHHNQNSNL